jgi:hypothetical protein
MKNSIDYWNQVRISLIIKEKVAHSKFELNLMKKRHNT